MSYPEVESTYGFLSSPRACDGGPACARVARGVPLEPARARDLRTPRCLCLELDVGGTRTEHKSFTFDRVIANTTRYTNLAGECGFGWARRNIRTRFYSQSHGSRQQNVALRSGLVLIQATETTPTHNALESLRQQTTKHARLPNAAPRRLQNRKPLIASVSPPAAARTTRRTRGEPTSASTTKPS